MTDYQALPPVQVGSYLAQPPTIGLSAPPVLNILTESDDLDLATRSGIYIIRANWDNTGAARWPAHAPEAFYSTSGDKIAPTIEPVMFVYGDSRGDIAQQIFADGATMTAFVQTVWYRTSSNGSFADQYFSLDTDVPQTVPSFTNNFAQSSDLNFFGNQYYPDGAVILASGNITKIDLAAFSKTISQSWKNTIVNANVAPIAVTSSGGTPLKVPSGHTPSILAGGTATIIGVSDFNGNTFYFLSGDLA